MALQPDNERSLDPGFVWSGVGWGPLNSSDHAGFIPSDAELDHQRQIAEARRRYQQAHPQQALPSLKPPSAPA